MVYYSSNHMPMRSFFFFFFLSFFCQAEDGIRDLVRSRGLGDVYKRQTERRSKTIGIALKDRSAILPIGRTGDAAYWFIPDDEGAFATSTWYRNELPEWLMAFNAEKRQINYLQNKWDLLLPIERYRQVMPDDNPYEEPIPGTTSPTLPMDLQALSLIHISEPTRPY